MSNTTMTGKSLEKQMFLEKANLEQSMRGSVNQKMESAKSGEILKQLGTRGLISISVEVEHHIQTYVDTINS